MKIKTDIIFNNRIKDINENISMNMLSVPVIEVMSENEIVNKQSVKKKDLFKENAKKEKESEISVQAASIWNSQSLSLPDLNIPEKDPGYLKYPKNENNANDKTDIDKEEEIIGLEPCPLQEKVENIIKDSEKKSYKEKPRIGGLFQWILRISCFTFVVLIILLLLVILGIPWQQGDNLEEIKRETILTEENVISFVNIKFKAPATNIETGGAETVSVDNGHGL